MPLSSKVSICLIELFKFWAGWMVHWTEVKDWSWLTPGHVSSFGVPRILKIFLIWSYSESPSKRARFVTISAKIQPADHISTGVEYSLAPRRSSGALYQRVTTSFVYGLIGIPKARARPKSAILSSSFWLRRMF
jgi:hypothetical protein